MATTLGTLAACVRPEQDLALVTGPGTRQCQHSLATTSKPAGHSAGLHCNMQVII